MIRAMIGPMIGPMIGTAALAGAVIVAPVTAHSAASLTERNRSIVADFADLFYTQRKPRDAMLKHVAPKYIQHNPQAGDGRDAAIALLEPLFGAPGATFMVKRIIVDGNLATIHVHGRPDPKGPGVVAIDIYRLENGKIVEHWDAIQPITPSAVNPHPFF